MAYPTIGAHRFLYNLDGTRVGYNNSNSFANGVTGYLNQTSLNTLQDNTGIFSDANGSDKYYCFWFFFPEKRFITHWLIRSRYNTDSTLYEIQGSNDTTNGIDGTWESFTYTNSSVCPNNPPENWWRTPSSVTVLSGNGYKVVRCRFHSGAGWNTALYNLHIYGRKSAGETPNDIVFVKADGTTEYTGLHEFDATMEGRTYNTDMYIKNTSITYTANNISVTLGGTNSSNITLSLDGTTYSNTLTITSLAPNTQQLIKVKTTIEKPATSLNPRNAYIRTTVASWT